MNRRDVILGMVAGGALVRSGAIAAASLDEVIVSKIAVVGQRVVMALLISGSGPYLFLVDTGGYLSLIDEGLAKSLKLRATGFTNAVGVGGAATLPVYLAKNVVFGGGAVQSAVAFGGIKTGFSGGIKGALAAGMMTSVDSDLDFEAGEWRSYPSGRPERVGFVRLNDAIRIGSGRAGPGAGSARLFGEAEVNGRRLRFLLDTGAPGAISLNEVAARALGLWSTAQPFAPQRTRGIGGSAGIGRLVRAESAMFGGVRFKRPIVLLHNEAVGGNGIDGIVGLDLLRGFNLSTEVRARALWVKPNRSGHALSGTYGLSGLWIDETNGAVRIGSVGTGSPAAAAGLQIGDRIVGETFREVLRKITGRPGENVTLKVDRKAGPQTVTFALAQYL